MYCPGCNRYDLTEADFGKDRYSKTGLQGYCKHCDNRKAREHYALNREAARESQRKYQQSNREQARLSWHRWAGKNREYLNAYNRRKAQENPEQEREWQWRAYTKRLKAYVAPVYLKKMYERDGWICQICREPVDPTLRYPDPMSASLDHIIPLARGGTHEPGNVQLAHWICNVKKWCFTA